jgi:hypothetical protein
MNLVVLTPLSKTLLMFLLLAKSLGDMLQTLTGGV